MAIAATELHPILASNFRSSDRLLVTILIAAAVHMAIVLGISFDIQELKSDAPQTLEVTLAMHQSVDKVEEADFLAQMDQQGSGTIEEKALPATTEQAAFQDDVIREANPIEQIASAPQQKIKEHRIITTTQASRNKLPEPTEADDKKLAQNDGANQPLLERSLEIATLEARLEWQRELYAKRPRITRLTAASTMRAIDAAYVDAWARKIERVGNINYPPEALQRKLSGEVRVMVAILPNGSVKNIEILKPSGLKVLDDSVKSIVRLAAPFAPFPDEIRQETDVLEIIRTWSFQNNLLSSS